LRRLQLCPAVLEHEKNLSEGKINGKYSKRKISAIHTAENSREKEIEAPLKNVQEGDSIITNPTEKERIMSALQNSYQRDERMTGSKK